MKRKRVVYGLLILCMIPLVCTPVSAFYYQETVSWECGLKYRVLVENIDIWSTDKQYAVYVTLTLLEIGIIQSFESVTCALYLHTNDVVTSVQTINNHWSEIGDVVRFTSFFTVTPDQVNNSGWNINDAEIFYQVNMSVLLDGNFEQNCYMNPRGPIHIQISTMSFMDSWLFIIIFIMTGIYYGGFIGLRNFNKRYEWFEGKRKKQPVVNRPDDEQPFTSQEGDSNY